MSAVAPQPAEPVELRSDGLAKKHIRGSTLLMSGRGISLVLNLAVHILTIRYLSKLDYGAFAYGLSMVSLASSFTSFGMDKAASRWAAIYHEQRDHARIFGTLILIGGTIVGLGLGVTLTVFGLRGFIGSHLVSSPLSLTLLLTLIVLAPVNSLNSVVQAALSVFSKPRLIFFRRHIVGPGLKLVAVLVVVAAGGSVHLLAAAYVVGGLVGLAIGVALLIQVLRDRDLWSRFRLASVRIPVREIFVFSLPMLHSDLVFVLRGSMVIFLIELFHDSSSVASYRAVLHVARLNKLVLESFGLLFIPVVARLLVRNNLRAVDDVHWRSAGWVTVLSFPLFAVSFSLAEPITVLLFGERYADSGAILAVLSLGFFFHAAVGLNALTLKVCGRIRHILAIDFGAILIALTLSLVLIPRFGPFGAAVAVCITLIAHAMLNQIGLSVSVGLDFFPGRFARVCVFAVLGALVLMLIQRWWAPPIYVGIILAGIAWLLLIVLGRPLLAVEDTFPELLRFALIRRLFGGSAKASAEQP